MPESQHAPMNPYRPPAQVEAVAEARHGGVQFHISNRLLRHGEAQYLLHWCGRRLLFGSLIMIAASAIVASITAAFFTRTAFTISIFASITASTLIYLALVHREKGQIRKNLLRLGLLNGTECSVEFVENQLVLRSANGIFHWPRHCIKSYQTRMGILLNPESLVYVMVPKRDGSSAAAYKILREEAMRQASPSRSAGTHSPVSK